MEHKAIPPLSPDRATALIAALPKAELHVHIEGTIEPELMFELAQRNGVKLRFATVEAVRAAYRFENLQSFLDIYYEGAQVLREPRDFRDLTAAYLARMRAENVRHVEIFFDPQTHSERGVPFGAVIAGIDSAARSAANEWGLTYRLIPNFLRHLSAESAHETLAAALPHRALITGFGLDSSERDHPPSKFAEVFRAVREAGFRAVAHAGEEGPPDYIRQALDLLHVDRIDHGVRCIEDPMLVARLAESRTPLTVCPLSNVRLRVFERLEDHNLKTLLRRGLCVTINSDDPAYFGGYLTRNFVATQQALSLTVDDLRALGRNAFEGSFLDPLTKASRLAEVDAAIARFA